MENGERGGHNGRERKGQKTTKGQCRRSFKGFRGQETSKGEISRGQEMILDLRGKEGRRKEQREGGARYS